MSSDRKQPRAADGSFSKPSPSLINRIVTWTESAGVPTEADSKRNGFLSYKSESHAASMGIAAGWYYGAQGETQLLSFVYGAAVYGRSYEASGQRRRLFKDIAREPHYALAGVVVGAVLGSATSQAVHTLGIDPGALLSNLPLNQLIATVAMAMTLAPF